MAPLAPTSGDVLPNKKNIKIKVNPEKIPPKRYTPKSCLFVKQVLNNRPEKCKTIKLKIKCKIVA